MSKWIKKGDTVKVIAGNDKGSVGEVLAVSSNKIIVKDVNKRKKHLKKTQENQQGQILEIERPINRSNVMLSTTEGTVIRLKTKSKEGKKVLYYMLQEKEVEYRTI
jgi:large subunit ribosomal protein L24